MPSTPSARSSRSSRWFPSLRAHRARFARGPFTLAAGTAATIAALVATVACGDEPTEPEPRPDVAGEYALVGFAGGTLPATVVHPADSCTRLTMVSGTLALEESDAFTLTQRYRYAEVCDSEGAEEERVVSGGLAADSSGTTTVDVTLTPDEGTGWWPMEGVVEEGRVTLEAEIPSEDRDSALFGEYVFERE